LTVGDNDVTVAFAFFKASVLEAFCNLLKDRWGVEEPWTIRHPDLSLYVKVNTADPETVEKVAIMRKEFFRKRDSKQKRVKPLPRKAAHLAIRGRPEA
jgi:hypothetical protein